MAKNTRYGGPSSAQTDIGDSQVHLPKTDLQLAGADSNLIVGGTVTFGGRLRRARGGVVGYEDFQTVGALARWRRRLAVARTGGLSTQIMFIGDSISEGYSVTRYRNRWIDLLGRRFRGASFGSMGFLPGSANLASVLDVDWAGGDNPWTFTGAVAANIAYGLGFHAITIPTAGSASFTYFGDKVSFAYVRTTDGPTAATMTIDGTSVGSTLNARGAVAPGTSAGPFGTNGAYGFHTFTVTPNDGPLVLEGAQWFDGDAPFFFQGSVLMLDATHVGFSGPFWAGANNDWSAQLAGSDAFTGLIVVLLGVNDQAGGRTAAQFSADLQTIVSRCDARIGNTDVGYLFVAVPGVGVAFADAMRAAADALGPERVGVFDMAALRPDRAFGSDLSADGSHPNNAGHLWVAEALGQVLDPTPVTFPPVTDVQTVISASTPPTFRSSWVAAITPVAGTTLTYDEATASALRERRHRMWLDAGTYQAVISAEHATGRGTLEVLIGNWQGNTPTLTSCGTVDTSTPAGPAVTTTVLGTSVSTQVPGYCPVVIRKTNAANVGRFVQLVINKTA